MGILYLFDVTTLTFGWSVVGLVTVFTEFVENSLRFWRFRFGIMTASTGACFDTLVMAGGTVSNSPLVSSVLEGDSAHAGFQLNFCWAVVGSKNGKSADGYKCQDNKQGQ
jgi:hypothetical protein